jgi:hypothetical protein
MYRIYVLNPDHHCVMRVEALARAKYLAKELVEKGYPHAEVWDALIPLWSVWRDGTGRSLRILTTDDQMAYG